MSVNIRKFLIGLGLVPSASSNVSVAGEMEVLSSDNKLHYYNGSTSSPVLTASSTDTVTNKSMDGGSNTFTNLPSGSISGQVTVPNGGTGDSSLTAHGILLGNGTSAVNVTAVGASNTVLHGNTGADPTYSAVSLTADVSGTLPLANGGTNSTSAQTAIDTLAGAVTSGSYLRGNGTHVVMNTIQVGDVPTLNQNTTGTAANITASSNSTLTTLSALSLPGSQVTGNISGNAANVTGTVAVANGGTGDTTLTAYAVLAGGTTSTGALQQVSGVGSSGQILTSNGASALPTWQTSTASTVQVGRYTNGTGVAAGTTLLMNFDQTPPTDFSPNNFTVTVNGSPTISSTQAKFGPSSYFVNSANASYQTQSGALGTGDFTVEFWAWTTSWSTSNGTFLNTQDGGGNWWLIRYAGSNQFEWNNSAGITFNSGSITPTTSAWHHFAFVRHSGNLNFYLDGALTIGPIADSENYTQAQLRVGFCSSQGNSFNGYIDEVRVSSIAQYTSAFTPPTSAFATTSTIETNPGSWISSLSSATTGVVTVNFTGGIFTAEPVITLTPISATGAGQATAQLTTVPSTSSVTVATYIGGSLANCDVEITAVNS